MGVRVTASSPAADDPPAAVTDDRGDFSLALRQPVPRGRQLSLEFSRTGYGRTTALLLGPLARDVHMDQVLFPCAVVKGSVIMKGGGALPDDVTVAYGLRRQGGDPPEAELQSIVAAGGGRFEIEFTETGIVRLGARAAGCRADSQDVEVGPFGSTREVDLLLEAIPVARVAVLDAEGRPPACPGCGGAHFNSWLRRSGTGEPAMLSFDVEENIVKIPLDLAGEWILEVEPSDSHSDLWPARLVVSAKRIPGEIRLRRAVPVLDATVAHTGDAGGHGLDLEGRYRSGAESGDLRFHAEAGATAHIRVLRPETTGPCEVELTLLLPGWRPWRRGPVTLQTGERLPDTEIRFTRD